MKSSQNHAMFRCLIQAAPALCAGIFTVFTIDTAAAPIADGCDKFLGNITTAGPPSNFLNYWNQVTLENNSKWANIEPQRDQYNWQPIQDAYDFCKLNKIPYKYHTFQYSQETYWLIFIKNKLSLWNTDIVLRVTLFRKRECPSSGIPKHHTPASRPGIPM